MMRTLGTGANWLSQHYGSRNWVYAPRRTQRLVDRYGADVVVVTPKQQRAAEEAWKAANPVCCPNCGGALPKRLAMTEYQFAANRRIVSLEIRPCASGERTTWPGSWPRSSLSERGASAPKAWMETWARSSCAEPPKRYAAGHVSICWRPAAGAAPVVRWTANQTYPRWTATGTPRAGTPHLAVSRGGPGRRPRCRVPRCAPGSGRTQSAGAPPHMKGPA